jgi:hypothetical protein
MDPNQTTPEISPSTPVQLVQPTAPPPVEQYIPQKKGMPKFVGFMLLILLILLMAGGSYVMNMKKIEPKQKLTKQVITPSPTKQSPTQLPTPTIMATTSAVPADWKTFTDASTTLSFQYPPDLQVIIQNYMSPQNAPTKVIELGKNNDRFFGVYYYPNDDNLSLVQLDKKLTVSDDAQGARSPGLSSADNQSVTIGTNISAYYTDKNIDCEPTICDTYIIPQKRRVFKIRISRTSETKDPIGQQMLSTLKLTQ